MWRSAKKACGPREAYYEKRCEIQDGSQEMAVIVATVYNVFGRVSNYAIPCEK